MNKEPDYKDHSIMLGRISSEVQDWAITENCTTLDAVRLLHATYNQLLAEKTIREIEEKYYGD